MLRGFLRAAVWAALVVLAGGTAPAGTEVTGTVTLHSAFAVVSSPLTEAAAAPLDLNRLNTANTSGLGFAQAWLGDFGTWTPIPAGAPAGTQIVQIPPAKGQSGCF